MKALIIEPSDDTPGILLDKVTGIFEISGRSLPEDAVGFYKPVLDWLGQYKDAPNATTSFTFKLEYANTASSKFIHDVLAMLKKIETATIIWYYKEDDEDIEAIGHEFSELIQVPFVFNTY